MTFRNKDAINVPNSANKADRKKATLAKIRCEKDSKGDFALLVLFSGGENNA